MTLYSSSLFSRLRFDHLPNSQQLLTSVGLICSFHVNLLSSYSPRYLTESLIGIMKLLQVTGVQFSLHRANVLCVDLFSFILNRHLWNHCSKVSRFRRRDVDAICRSSRDQWSSANVAVITCDGVGRSVSKIIRRETRLDPKYEGETVECKEVKAIGFLATMSQSLQ